MRPLHGQKVTSNLDLDLDLERIAAARYLSNIGASAAEEKAVRRAASAIIDYERWTRLPRYGELRGKSYSALRGQQTADEILRGVTRDIHRWYALAQAALRFANARRGHKVTPAHLRRKNRQREEEAA